MLFLLLAFFGATAAAEPVDFAERTALLKDIATWRRMLPEPEQASPLRTQFAPPLDAIETRAKAAATPPEVAKIDPDFKKWQHEFILAKCRIAPVGCTTTAEVNRYSTYSRLLTDFVDKADRTFKIRAAAQNPNLVFDNATQTLVPVADAPRTVAVVTGAAGGVEPRSGPTLVDRGTPPPVTSEPMLWDSVIGWVDSTRGGRIAHAAASGVVGFAHWCWAGVKEAFIAARDRLWAKIKDPTESGRIGIPPALAAQFARAVNRDPKLLAQLGYRRVDPSTIPGNDPSVIPEGTIFNYSEGCAGYSSEAGHIELSAGRYRLSEIKPQHRPNLGANEVLLISDGAHGRTLHYLRTWGSPRRLGRRVVPACMNMYVPVVDPPTPPPLPRTIAI